MLKKIITILSISLITNIQASNISVDTKNILESSNEFKKHFFLYNQKNEKSAFNPVGNYDSIEDFKNTLKIIELKNFKSPIKNSYALNDGVFGLIKDKNNLYLTIQADVKTLKDNVCKELNHNKKPIIIEPFTLTNSLYYLDNNYACFKNKNKSQNLYIYKIN